MLAADTAVLKDPIAEQTRTKAMQILMAIAFVELLIFLFFGRIVHTPFAGKFGCSLAKTYNDLSSPIDRSSV
jgi:hypothetical protein